MEDEGVTRFVAPTGVRADRPPDCVLVTRDAGVTVNASHSQESSDTIHRGEVLNMVTEAEAIVRRFITEMWTEQRIDLVDELVHPEYRADGELVGREFVRRNIARMHRGFSDLILEITHVVTDGDRVALMFEWVGTHDGLFAGIEATGRRVRFREACFFRVKDGMVVEGDFVSDGLGARIQLGVLPKDFWTNPHR